MLIIECPFEEGHSNHGGEGTFIVDAGKGTGAGFVVNCKHNSCCDRDSLEFVQKMLDDKWFDASIITDEAFNIELVEEEQAAAQKKGVEVEKPASLIPDTSVVIDDDETHKLTAAQVTQRLQRLAVEGASNSEAAAKILLWATRSGLGKTVLHADFKNFVSEVKADRKKYDADLTAALKRSTP